MTFRTYPTADLISLVPPLQTSTERVVELTQQLNTNTSAQTLITPSVELARLAKGSWRPKEEGTGTSVEIVRRMREEGDE